MERKIKSMEWNHGNYLRVPPPFVSRPADNSMGGFLYNYNYDHYPGNTIMTISFNNHSSSFLVEPRGVRLVVKDLRLRGLIPRKVSGSKPHQLFWDQSIRNFAPILIVLLASGRWNRASRISRGARKMIKTPELPKSSFLVEVFSLILMGLD